PHVGLLYSRPGNLDRLNTDRLRTALQFAPEKIETGTLNHAAIAGVSAAINFIASLGDGESIREKLLAAYRIIGEHERKLAAKLYDGLSSTAGITIAGPDFSSPQRAPTVSFHHASKSATAVCRRLS